MRINLDKQYDLALGDAIRMADGFFLKEQFAQAKQAYTQIAHHHPRSPHVMHSLGLIAAKQQDHSEAERLLTEAVELDPQHAASHAFARHRISRMADHLSPKRMNYGLGHVLLLLLHRNDGNVP
ncbi:MAG: tetratricopeptide repeat protein [Planctomycetota bacterium]|jgi:tetratricopeptide (TPR) repeat protein